jgi:hypothetical protein
MGRMLSVAVVVLQIAACVAMVAGFFLAFGLPAALMLAGALVLMWSEALRRAAG